MDRHDPEPLRRVRIVAPRSVLRIYGLNLEGIADEDCAAAVDDVARQAEQISTAIQSAAIEIRSFLGRLKLSGSRGSLKQVDRAGHQVLAAWGEASDPESEKRLLKLSNLIRNKFRSEKDGLQRPFRVGLLPPAVVVQPARRLSGGEASDSL